MPQSARYSVSFAGLAFGVSSFQAHDYTLRFEGPDDTFPVPKQAEAIEFPGMVVEKSSEYLDREQRLAAEREVCTFAS